MSFMSQPDRSIKRTGTNEAAVGKPRLAVIKRWAPIPVAHERESGGIHSKPSMFGHAQRHVGRFLKVRMGRMIRHTFPEANLLVDPAAGKRQVPIFNHGSL